MKRFFGKLMIDGNAVYEIDEACMERRRKIREELERRYGKEKGEAEEGKKEP
ncbi:MAG: hypothetical protein Q4F29_10590 [Lachnospiraceae bacterium]|nr:hypothetical protein [Lachnospiraceae bacterium]